MCYDVMGDLGAVYGGGGCKLCLSKLKCFDKNTITKVKDYLCLFLFISGIMPSD